MSSSTETTADWQDSIFPRFLCELDLSWNNPFYLEANDIVLPEIFCNLFLCEGKKKKEEEEEICPT